MLPEYWNGHKKCFSKPTWRLEGENSEQDNLDSKYGLSDWKLSDHLCWHWTWEQIPQLALKRWQGQVQKSTNLKLGMGDPWAGHFRVKIWLCFLDILVKSVSDENFGAEPPMGSNKMYALRFT